MGEIYKISCKCGYEKELNIGGGLSSCNINMVNKLFNNEKLNRFHNYLKNKEVRSFIIEEELSLCTKCKEILTVSVLKVQLIDSRRIEIKNDCPICKNEIKIINGKISCPKCQQVMTKEEIGYWD